MTDWFGSLIVRGAAVAAALVLSAACNGGAADDPTEPSDTATSPTPSAVEARPSPTPTPTATATGPDDEGWAEHLGLTEEELEQRRASDDFLEFAEPRRAREHPRFRNTHGNIGLETVPGDGLGGKKGDWGRSINPRKVADDFLEPFRDTLLAENLDPADSDNLPDVGGSYVHRIGRSSPDHRQLLMAVAFYESDQDQYRARVALAAADVKILDAQLNRVELNVANIDTNVTDVDVGESWDKTYDEQVYDPVGEWLETHR